MRVRVIITTLVVILLWGFPASWAGAEESPQSEKGKLPHVLGATLGAPIDVVVNTYSEISQETIRRKGNVLVYPVLLTSLSHVREKEVEYWSFEGKLAQMIVRFEGAESTYNKLAMALTNSYGKPVELKEKLQKDRPMLKEWFSREYNGLKISLDIVGMPTIRYKYLPLTIPMEDAEVEKF